MLNNGDIENETIYIYSRDVTLSLEQSIEFVQ
jgi:hypothetical protein